MIEAILTDEKRRRWNPFRRRRFVLSIPQSWGEVSPLARRERWWRWVATLPPDQARKRVLESLVPTIWRRKMNPFDAGSIAGHLDWIAPEPNAEIVVLESFFHDDVRYVFPKPKGPNVSCIEFALCDDYYKEFVAGNTEALLMVSACLWREEDEDEREMLKRGDERVLVHGQAEVEARVKRLAGAPQEVHVQALIWWIGMKMLVHKMYGAWLFEQDDDDDEDDQPENTKASDGKPNFGWWGIFLDVAEAGVFGPLEKVYQASIHDICIFLVKKRAEANQNPESPKKPTDEDDDE